MQWYLANHLLYHGAYGIIYMCCKTIAQFCKSHLKMGINAKCIVFLDHAYKLRYSFTVQ